MELGRSKAEVELTKKLAATLVQHEVIEPMQAGGWRHGTPPSPEQAAVLIAERARQDGATDEQITAFLAERGVKYTPPASGTTPQTEGAPASVAPVAPATTSGQPTPGMQGVQPAQQAKTDAPADLAAAQNVLTSMESLRDANGLIMGKYKTVQEALNGAGHLANMAKAALARAEAAEARQGSSVTVPQTTNAAPPAAAPAAAPVQRTFTPASRADVDAAQARLDRVLSRVVEGGGTFDGDSAKELSAAQRELARAEAEAAAEDNRRRAEHSTAVENDKWNAISEYMSNKYPESVRFSEEVGLYVGSNPLLAEAVKALVAQGRGERGAELAWTEFDKSRGGSAAPVLSRAEAERQEIDLAAREQVRKEARDAALKDAGVVHGSAGGNSSVETPGITGPSQDDINSLAGRMRREGESPGSSAAQQWRHAVIGRFLPPELFGPSGR